MKITDVEIIPLNVPMISPIRNSYQRRGRREFSRVLVKMITDEGLVGLGETWCSPSVLGLIRDYTEFFIGRDPFDLESILRRLKWGEYWAGYSALSAVSGLEIACWDLMGKATNRPVYDLLGGRYRDEIEFSGYLFYRETDKTGPQDIPERTKYSKDRACIPKDISMISAG